MAIKTQLARLKEKGQAFSLDIVLPLFILNLALNLAHFFPNLTEINYWDEATYIQVGYLLLTRGELPNLASSPLSSVFYALTTLPVLGSPFWFMLSDAIGRIILFCFVFWSVYLISRALKPYANPWIMLALVTIVPIAETMFLFPSDILFAGFAGLAFWQMLIFYQKRSSRSLIWASIFMGVGALARAEGILLVGVMAVATLIMVLPGKKWLRPMLSILVPFALIVGGFVLGYGLATGDFGTGLPQRTFNNFESGHEVIYSRSGIYAPTISARLESQAAFGTPEENDYSVIRAILRNPPVYWHRLKMAFVVFPEFLIKAYGNKFLLILIWLSLRGIVELIRKKHIPLLVLCVLWFVPLGVGFLNTFFREGYFKMPYFVIFSLAAIGLTAIIRHFEARSERIGLAASGVVVLALSVLFRNPSMAFRNALFVFGLLMVYVLWRRRKTDAWQVQALWLLLAAALILRGGYLSPALPSYGKIDAERAVLALQETLPSGSGVLAGAPAPIWAAKMSYAGINAGDIPHFEDSEAFIDWLRVQDIRAVFLDEHFPAYYLPLVEDQIDKGLVLGFTSGEIGLFKFYLVQQAESSD